MFIVLCSIYYTLEFKSVSIGSLLPNQLFNPVKSLEEFELKDELRSCMKL